MIMKKKVFTSLGIMSGTSMDGIDLSIIESDGIKEFEAILDDYYEFDSKLQKKIENLRDKLFNIDDLDKNLIEVNEIEREITLFVAEKVNRFIKNTNQDIDIIGFHGQTILHDSQKKISKQLGNGKLLSSLTNKIVVDNFREKDLLNGGQGAPLTPIFHKIVSKSIHKNHKIQFPISILNIGGIANITKIIDENDDLEANIFAYDIGPGNCLIDSWIKKNSHKKFDFKGNLAKSGNVNQLILNQAIDNFCESSFDKSLDVKDFDLSFAKGLSFEDGCATITKFTAHLISEGINFADNSKDKTSFHILVAGGGRKNEFLMNCLKKNLSDKGITIDDIDNYSFDGDFIESQAFAYLAIRNLLQLPITFPNTTRCVKPSLGGDLNKNF